jgi:hypothetical protein
MGDARKYQLLSNGEVDFDQVHLADSSWIHDHPQDGHAWSFSGRPSNVADIANGFDARYLLSLGPLGNPSGDHTELAPGETFEVWMAYVGGMNFHNAAHPQPTNVTIDPSLFDFTDLVSKVQMARAGTCFDWTALSAHTPQVAPANFALEPIYPNPFNSTASIRFTLSRESMVKITVFDILGREVDRIASGNFAAGNHSLSWDAHGLSSGLYFIQARAGDNVRAVQKAMLLR